jgi:hypothetical protein
MRYLTTKGNKINFQWEPVTDMTTSLQTATQKIAHELFDSYDTFKAAEITSCRITHEEVQQWLRPLQEQHRCTKLPLGASGEGRPISLYAAGSGSINVLLWSQMHGDEPTATMALIDMFNFFLKNPGHRVTKTIQETLTLLAIPMLNPDGAERFTRRTAQLIDVNRDAVALETPEARILKEARSAYQPEYGFNLHDQDTRMTVGTTKKITAIALLAPSTDESRSDNPVRVKAKKVASVFAQAINLFIPGHLAKWDDTFEPRAFGDNIQKWGTSTVLVESGGWQGDPNKFFLRKLNCIALLTTLYAIAVGESATADIEAYEHIPFNMKLGCDHIIRNAVLRVNSRTAPIRVDIGINFEKRRNDLTASLEHVATIVDIGDLSTFTALEEDVDAHGAELEAERIKLDCFFSAGDVALLFKHQQP